MPDEAAREKIFKIHTRGKPLAEDVNFQILARLTEGHVGAEIETICREASLAAIREFLKSKKQRADYATVKISMKHFEEAIGRTSGTTR
jgi:transitional endoplasmic reticulum ATPase